jgi:hypothetical protein
MKNANRIRPKGSKPAPVQQPETTPIPQPQSASDRSWYRLHNLESAVTEAVALLDSQAAPVVCRLREDRGNYQLQRTVRRGITLMAESVSNRLLAAFNEVHTEVGILQSGQKGGRL